ncbi:MAG: beta-galactosidase, partial [Fimbriimonadales bacterium]
LERGDSPTPFAPPAEANEPFIVMASLPHKVYLSERSWAGTVEFYLPQAEPNLQVEVSLGEQSLRQSASLPAGYVRAEFQFEEPNSPETVLQVRLRPQRGQPVEATMPIRFYQAREARQRLDAIQAQLPRWQERLQAIRNKGQDIAYPQATFTILQEFVRYVGEDIEKRQIERAFQQLAEMEPMAERLNQLLDAVERGERSLPTVPRYVTSPVELQGTSLIADTVNPLTNERQRQPVFFVGFGHFGQVRQDVEKFPLMGFNLIQIERGVWDIFPEKGKVSLQAMEEDVVPVLKRAAQANVKVDYLISPHYMPEWVYEEYPHLRQKREGFLKYSLFAPESTKVLRDYIAQITPFLRNQPALLSICLSNEPTNRESPESPLHLQAWRTWLQNRHRNLVTLNTRWKTNYASWDEVPVPTEGVPFAEWTEFNAEALANWHRPMAEAFNELLPGVPKHSKLMNWTFLNDRERYQGVDPEYFAEFCELNGNDAGTGYSYSPGAEWAFNWVRTLMAHDFQRSLRNAPLINSENHIIPDRERRFVPPQHARAVLWSEALHGVSATTFWVWERTDDPKSDFAGSLLHRPGVVEALAHTTLDLNRLAPYIAALQNQPPDVYLLHSPYDLVLQGVDAVVPRDTLYIVLRMLGVRVGFITERQLERRTVPSTVQRVLVANSQYLSDEAFLYLDSLRQSQGTLLLGYGEPLLVNDRYGRRRGTRAGVTTVERNPFTPERALHRRLDTFLGTWGVVRPLNLRTPDNQPAWGVAYHTAPYEQGFVASLCNYTKQPITVRLLDAQGKPVRGVNLLDGSPVDEVLTLQPQEPILIRWETPKGSE